MRIQYFRFLVIALICVPLFLLSANNDTKQLILERSARVLASYLVSLNPNENLFYGSKKASAIYPKDLFDKNMPLSYSSWGKS